MIFYQVYRSEMSLPFGRSKDELEVAFRILVGRFETSLRYALEPRSSGRTSLKPGVVQYPAGLSVPELANAFNSSYSRGRSLPWGESGENLRESDREDLVLWFYGNLRAYEHSKSVAAKRGWVPFESVFSEKDSLNVRSYAYIKEFYLSRVPEEMKSSLKFVVKTEFKEFEPEYGCEPSSWMWHTWFCVNTKSDSATVKELRTVLLKLDESADESYLRWIDQRWSETEALMKPVSVAGLLEGKLGGVVSALTENGARITNEKAMKLVQELAARAATILTKRD